MLISTHTKIQRFLTVMWIAELTIYILHVTSAFQDIAYDLTLTNLIFLLLFPSSMFLKRKNVHIDNYIFTALNSGKKTFSTLRTAVSYCYFEV